MTPPTGPDLLLSILDLDPTPAFTPDEAAEIRQAIGPACRDCAELAQTVRDYEDRHAIQMQVIEARERDAAWLRKDRDVLIRRNNSLRLALAVDAVAIVGLVCWAVWRG